MDISPYSFVAWEEVEPVIPTVDPADIRGLVTTLLASVRRLPLSGNEGSITPLNVVEGYAKPGLHLFPTLPFIDWTSVSIPPVVLHERWPT